MEYREFGRAKVRVPVIGMGVFYDVPWIVAARILGYHRGRRDKVAALRKGIELGIGLIDTAEVYETEPLVAEAIKGYEREELFIATKVSQFHLRYDQVLKAAERSLSRLRCSYIDLYQVHWPSRRAPIPETMKAMERLADEGKIRYIGVSNFSVAQTREADEALSKHRLASNQVEYSLLARSIEADLLPYCERNGIVILAYRPVAHGALANPSGRLRSVMEEVSQKHGGKTPAQVALNWLLSKSRFVFPIPRASRPARVVENAGAAGWSLTPDELTKLEAVAR